jgi:FKBP-type peptidyl-prolyl cis-trans isomerase SlyD
MNDELKVQDGQVVSIDYTLRVEGEIVDSSEGQDPLEFLQGAGNIIPGLERELYGMAIGENKKVVVAAADAYGEFEEEAVVSVPKSEFPSEIPLELGTELQVRGQDGETMYGHISEIGEENIELDFNHPLAGKELHFDVTITALRDASDEELLHGHVHGDEHDEDEDDKE